MLGELQCARKQDKSNKKLMEDTASKAKEIKSNPIYYSKDGKYTKNGLEEIKVLISEGNLDPAIAYLMFCYSTKKPVSNQVGPTKQKIVNPVGYNDTDYKESLTEIELSNPNTDKVEEDYMHGVWTLGVASLCLTAYFLGCVQESE